MADRRARGAVFTPPAIARSLCRAAVDGRTGIRTVADPAAGDGRLLDLAGAMVGIDDLGLFGADLDSGPWVSGPLGGRDVHFLRGDSLAVGIGIWPTAPERGFDLVIGNPPFRGQLRERTWLSSAEREVLSGRYRGLARGYVDTASLFLVAACEMAATNGRVAFIMPLSFLAARDAAPARRRVLELATLDGLWVCPAHVFPDAQVQVCAVILDRSGPRSRAVRRWVGEGFEPIEPVTVDSDELAERSTWGHLAAPAFGIPEIDLDGSGVLGESAAATAGFRDEYYGLAELVGEDPGTGSMATPGWSPVVTSGLIDTGSVAWGGRQARIAKHDWARPAIEIEQLEAGSRLERWVRARLASKVIVATQTRVIEPVPDPDGELVPLTPVIAVHASGDDLWRALAVLLAPPVSAWARSRHLGAARSATALKLSARQVGDLPLPADRDRWDAVAQRLERVHRTRGQLPFDEVQAAGRQMTPAYGCDDSVTEWWMGELGRGARSR